MRALSVVRSGGGAGVTLFFVLSGYLVSGILFREYRSTGGVDIHRFLARRGLKLYPPYWTLLAAYAVLSLPVLWSDTPRLFWESLTVRLLFLQNYFPRFFDHTWTLAVEEHFYITIAFVTAAFLRLRRAPFGWVPTVFTVTAIANVMLRNASAASPGGPAPSDFVATQYQIDALFFGVLLSYLAVFHALDQRLERIPSFAIAAAGAALMFGGPVGLVLNDIPGAPLAHVSMFVGAGLIVLAARRLVGSPSKVLRGAGFLGETSYSTYLWHGFANIFAAKLPEKLAGHCDPLVYTVGYIAGSFAIGVVMHRLIERPAMRLRDRLFPRKTM